MDEISRFGAGGGTNISPLGVVIVLATIVFLFLVPRQYMLVPFLVTTFCVPPGQEVVVGGIHLMMYRIIILFCWIRLWTGPKDERGRVGSHPLDRLFIAWAVTGSLAFWILWGEWGALVNRMGFLYDALSLFFFLRHMYRSAEDIELATKTLVWVSAFIALCMLNEQATGRNVLAMFGGVPFVTPVREGHVRAQASFGYCILAGTFGATIFPLFVALWWKDNKNRALAFVGMAAAITIAFASSSATPLLGLAASLAGLLMWPLRRQMRLIRWGILSTLVGLHMVMKAPVWALIARVDIVGGSSSDHRFELVDKFIRHFSEWWMVGTQHPGAWGWDMFDLANTYVGQGVSGGLITLILFIALISVGFRAAGLTRKATEDNSVAVSRVSWCLGAALFAHVVSYFGISYWDQNQISWYSLLAMIAGLHIAVSASVSAPSPAEAQPTIGLNRASAKPQMGWSAAENTRRPVRVKS